MESSMLPIFEQKQPERFAKQLPTGVRPIRVDWKNGGECAQIQFSDGKSSPGSCIRCTNPPCMEYAPSELILPIFSDFPADKNNGVCPTGAITWPHNEYSPTIDGEICISCGLCVSRCPVRAIYLSANQACINDEPNKHFVVQTFRATKTSTHATSNLFRAVVERGVYRTETDETLNKFLSTFEQVAADMGVQFPNHLARNLLLACGIGAAMRRRGDTNIRMDMVLGPPGVQSGTGEVEFGGGVLDAPRNILDNVAVLIARYELDRDSIIPLIVTLSLPNQRSEYWQVVRDISTVLNVSINTITIGALVLLVWNRRRIKMSTGDEFYIDVGSPSLRPIMERVLGRSLNVTVGYPGLLESGK